MINSIYLAQKKNGKYSLFEEYSVAAPELPVSIEEKADLYDAIDLLSPVYKTVVILQYFQGMKIKAFSFYCAYIFFPLPGFPSAHVVINFQV